MVKYIMSGDRKTVENIIKDCRLLCQRGLIEFTPAESVVFDQKSPIIVDVKDVNDTDDKTPKAPKRNKKSE